MLHTMVVGPLEVNCYILWDDSTKDAFIIDPGGDADDIKALAVKEKLKVKYIVNTHGHFDHVGGDKGLKTAFGEVRLAIHKSDSGLLSEAHEHGVMYGIMTGAQPAPDMFLEDNAELLAGALSLKVIHTPGHTAGGVCLYEHSQGLLFTGDTLFAGGIGRTDFPGGSYEAIMDSIKSRLLTLGDKVKVYPGHGPSSTIGREKKSNPFITGDRS